jgi:hypothetical protein
MTTQEIAQAKTLLISLANEFDAEGMTDRKDVMMDAWRTVCEWVDESDPPYRNPRCPECEKKRCICFRGEAAL